MQIQRRSLIQFFSLSIIFPWNWFGRKHKKPMTLGELAKQNSEKFSDRHKELLNKKHNEYKYKGLDKSIKVVGIEKHGVLFQRRIGIR